LIFFYHFIRNVDLIDDKQPDKLYNMEDFIDALTNNTSLKELSINFPLHASPDKLAHLFEFNKTLTSLTLESPDTNTETVIALFKGLEKNATIKSLKFKKLNNTSIPYLTMMLSFNKSVTTLELASSKVEEQAITLLVATLRHCKKLKTLDISNSPLVDEAALILADYIEHHNTLTHLCLTNCSISDHAAQTIFRTLKTDTNLRYLDMAFNRFGNSITANGLIECLQSNKTLIEVNVQINFEEDSPEENQLRNLKTFTTLFV